MLLSVSNRQGAGLKWKGPWSPPPASAPSEC